MPIQKYWKHDEDKLLITLVEKYKKAPVWAKISAQLKRQKINKTAKQCKRRYQNHLASYINNSKLSIEEQQRLFAYFRQHGNSWKQISKMFNNRTDSIIKNTFFSMIRKCIRKMNGLVKWEVNNKIINKSVPKTISEFLEMKSRPSFTPSFKIVDVIQVFIDHLEEGNISVDSDLLMEKVEHSIHLFKDLRQDRNKKIKKKKKEKQIKHDVFSEEEEEQPNIDNFYLDGPYARRKRASKRRSKETNSQSTIEEEKAQKKENEKYQSRIKIPIACMVKKAKTYEEYGKDLVYEVLCKLRGFYYSLQSYKQLTCYIINSPHQTFLNCFIEFVSFVRIYVSKTSLLRKVEVFIALNKLISTSQRLITELCEMKLNGEVLHVSRLEMVIYDISGLYSQLSNCLSTDSAHNENANIDETIEDELMERDS